MTRLPSEIMRHACAHLPRREQLASQYICSGTVLSQHVVHNLYRQTARDKHIQNPLQNRDVVVRHGGKEQLMPTTGTIARQMPIVLIMKYDDNTPNIDRIEQIRGKKCYIQQLVLNASQDTDAPLGSYVRDLIEASVYIGKLSIAKTLFPLNDELLSLIEDNPATIETIAFDGTADTTIDPRLEDLGFNTLKNLHVGSLHLCTLSKAKGA